jgi:chaperonin GroEL (HSP60 family)
MQQKSEEGCDVPVLKTYASQQEVADIRRDLTEALQAVSHLLKDSTHVQGGSSTPVDIADRVELLQSTTDMLQEGLDNVVAVAEVWSVKVCYKRQLTIRTCYTRHFQSKHTK